MQLYTVTILSDVMWLCIHTQLQHLEQNARVPCPFVLTHDLWSLVASEPDIPLRRDPWGALALELSAALSASAVNA
eukprot:2191103-Amphidinium_carterae.3